MTCLRLLINISCCADATVYLLAAKVKQSLYLKHYTVLCIGQTETIFISFNVLLYLQCPPGMHGLLDHHQPEDILVRSATLLLNLVTHIDTLDMTWSSLSSSRTDPMVTEVQSVHHLLTGPIGLTELSRRSKLLRYHPNEEIAQRCAKLVSFCQQRLNE